MKKIIAFVGMCGAGKSIATAIAEKQGFSKVYFGGIVIEQLKLKKLKVTEANERAMREDLRIAHGMAAFAILSIPKIDAISSDVVIDGLYSWAEYKLLQERYKGHMTVIAIACSPATRYARLAVRKERPLTLEEARTRSYSEVEKLDKGGPIAMADFTIINEGTQEELERGVIDVIRKIK